MVQIENELIGRRLRQIRSEAGLDYTEMGDILEVSAGHYRKIERGVYGLDAKKIIMLYKKMGVDPLYLLVGNPGMDEAEQIDGERAERNNLVCELLDYCKKQLIETVED